MVGRPVAVGYVPSHTMSCPFVSHLSLSLPLPLPLPLHVQALLATKTHLLRVHVVDVTTHPERRADLAARGLKTVPQIFLPTGLIAGGNAGLQQLHRDGKLDTVLAEAAATSSPVVDMPLPLPDDEGLLLPVAATAVDHDDDDDSSDDDDEAAAVTTLPEHPSGLPAVYIMHDNDAWTEPYRAAFRKAGVPYVEWRLGTGAVDTSGVPPRGVFFNRASASSHTRGDRWSMEHAASVVAWLEAHGRTVVGGSDAVALEVSKARQVVQLAVDGVASPHTDVVVGGGSGGKSVARAIRRRLPRAAAGVIVKPNRGGSGTGVRLVRSAEQARQLAKAGAFSGSLDGTWLVQDYVPGKLYRLEFVGGKFMYALAIKTAVPAATTASSSSSSSAPTAGEDMSNCPLHDDEAEAAEPSFGNCPADSCNIDDEPEDAGAGAGSSSSSSSSSPASPKFVVHTEFTHSVVARLEAFLHRTNIAVAGIEVVVDDDGDAYVIDANVVNSNHNRAAEARAGLTTSGVERVVSYLHGLMESGTGKVLPRVASSASSASLESDCGVSVAVAAV